MDNWYIDRQQPYFAYKYYPSKIEDLFINEIKINQLTTWLKSYNKNSHQFKNISKKRTKNEISLQLDDNDTIIDDEQITVSTKKNTMNDKSNIIITGPHGCGKTVMVTTVLTNLDYDIKIINFEKINEMENIQEFIDKTVRGIDIYNIITNKKITKQRAIIVDNVEIVSSPNEKQFIQELLKLNDAEWVCPIIFICNNKHNKLINIIKKASFEIKLISPTSATMMDICARVCVPEKIAFENEKICNQFIEQARKDIRLLITNIQTINDIFKKKVFGTNELDEFLKISKIKDQDLGIFEATRKLMYSYENMDDVIRIFETEKTIIPLMIQHHYVDFLGDKNFKSIKEISNSLARGDIVENYIYDNNIYDIRDTQAYYQCVKPSYIVSNKLNPRKTNVDQLRIPMLSFPLDLNKTSIKHINYTKNIVPSNTYFKNMNLDDYIYLNKILKGLILTENYNKINELMEEYNIDINCIETVLKINKLNGEKFVISTKIKKHLINNNIEIIKPKKQPIKTKKNIKI